MLIHTSNRKVIALFSAQSTRIFPKFSETTRKQFGFFLSFPEPILEKLKTYLYEGVPLGDASMPLVFVISVMKCKKMYFLSRLKRGFVHYAELFLQAFFVWT